MKSATTTLHEQLARQPGVFMSVPKEPSFFSDDAIHARGWGWYSALFRGAGADQIRGESSTHYAKLPTYPRTIERMARALPSVKLIYVMRHPIDRLISHYVHEAAVGAIRLPPAAAIERHPELVEYGRYAMQIAPYLDTFGPASVLPVFFSRLVNRSQDEIARIGRFLGAATPFTWDAALGPFNRGVDRLRPSPIREALVTVPVITPIRQRLLSTRLSGSLKRLWRADIGRPTLSPDLIARLVEVFDADLAQLAAWLGTELDCESFHEKTLNSGLDWASQAAINPIDLEPLQDETSARSPAPA